MTEMETLNAESTQWKPEVNTAVEASQETNRRTELRVYPLHTRMRLVFINLGFTHPDVIISDTPTPCSTLMYD